MASIFRKDDSVSNHPKRNAFDLSFQNNFTTKFGQLLPVFCQEVLPGDSFKIKPKFALRYLPQVFPVQTRQRAHLHFFYVRNRAVWSEWMDFIGKTKEGLVPPYLKMDNLSKHNYISTGSLGDAFGLPTVLQYNGSSNYLYSDAGSIFGYDALGAKNGYFDFTTGQFKVVSIANADSMPVFHYRDELRNKSVVCTNQDYVFPYRLSASVSPSQGLVNPYIYKFPFEIKFPENTSDSALQVIYKGTTAKQIALICKFLSSDGNYYYGYHEYTMKASTDWSTSTATAIPRTSQTLFAQDGTSLGTGKIVSVLGYFCTGENSMDYQLSIRFSLRDNSPIELTNLLLASLPFESTETNFLGQDRLRISALPFRHYEAIYNSFYRNAENNPFMINGVPEYNKYVRNTGGGADITHYYVNYRNWEDDFLTTALPSPQQGNAPKVGLTGEQGANVIIANEDGTKTTLTLKAGSDGVVQMVLPSGTTTSEDIKPFVSMVDYGITINDFRNVNSFQRWLENNIRKGYKYRDQIKAHYGVTVRYDELLLPEFIGGVSRDISVQQVTQTAEGPEGNLGDIAGQSYIQGSGKSISHYCDEHGFIIGILSVVPMANYSQMLPKHMIKSDAFDYYFPEFGKIGMQPISNKEVALLQSWQDGNLNECFGYQRPWYDYLANVDQVHGLFRSDFSNFILSRVFGKSPSLGSDFTVINPDTLNNTFYSKDDKDKILGQIYFGVAAKRAIPEYGIPALE